MARSNNANGSDSIEYFDQAFATVAPAPVSSRFNSSLLSRTMDISPVTLPSRFISLEPMTFAHEQPLIAAAADGDLWNTDVTIIPHAEGMKDYIQYALDGLAQGNQLPFVIRYAGVSSASAMSEDMIVGTTRFYEIFPTIVKPRSGTRGWPRALNALR